MQQFLVYEVVRMVRVELQLVFEVWVRMYPDGVLAAFKACSEYGCHRARAELCVCHREHVGFQTGMSYVPVEVVSAPFWVEPSLMVVL